VDVISIQYYNGKKMIQIKLTKKEWVECCNDCGEKRYAKYKPFREIGAITMSVKPCKLCNGDNVKDKRPVIYAIDWQTMCRKVNYFD